MIHEHVDLCKMCWVIRSLSTGSTENHQQEKLCMLLTADFLSCIDRYRLTLTLTLVIHDFIHDSQLKISYSKNTTRGSRDELCCTVRFSLLWTSPLRSCDHSLISNPILIISWSQNTGFLLSLWIQINLFMRRFQDEEQETWSWNSSLFGKKRFVLYILLLSFCEFL